MPGDELPATAPQVPVRVVIVDDSALFRQTARDLLERRGFHVVGEADGVASGLGAVAGLSPDAVLLDMRLPDGSGLDLCELLTRKEGAPSVLLVSSNGAADRALAKAHGARGAVAKADLAHVDLHAMWDRRGRTTGARRQPDPARGRHQHRRVDRRGIMRPLS